MSEAKTQHTPGTWTAARLDTTGKEAFAKYVCDTIEIGSDDAFYLVIGQKPDGPADICHTGNGPTSAANARLIAAAPDLLKACEAVSDCFAVFPSGKINMASAEEARAACALVVAAVAKAGEPVIAADWIQTYSGTKFHPLSPRVDEVLIEDIAHALANTCRYTGHCKRFYSVAEHSLHVANRVQHLTGDRDLALWGLLHDASEAYLCDIARPVKMQPEFAAYREAEKRLMAVICEKFKLPAEEPAVVKQADLEMLSTEAHALMAPMHPEWAATAPQPFPAPLARPTAMQLGCRPADAERLFLLRYIDLAGGR